MMQRRFSNASRYAGLDARVSARALIIRAAPRVSFDHHGTRPQRRTSRRRSLSASSTACTLSVGATFHDGSVSVSRMAASK